VSRVSTPSLPGVYFTAPPARRPLFPRLDVAAFVGYAERGPTDLAVAVEDPRQYEAVFGGDLALARDEEGSTVHAHLPSAVRAFFANGGRRCHVVRVAGRAARAARFRVPGLVAVSPLGDPALATVDASSAGRWANTARLAARLDALPLPAEDFSSGADSLSWSGGAASAGIEPGDVVRLRLAAAADRAAPRDLAMQTAGAWALGLAAGGAIGASWRVSRLTASGAVRVGTARALEQTTDGTRLRLGLDSDDLEVQPGDLLLIDPDPATSPGASPLLVGVHGVRPGAPGSPPSHACVEVEAGPATALASSHLPSTARDGFARVERLRFELQVRAGAAGDVSLGDLAFGPSGSRSWLDVIFPESAAMPPVASARAQPAAITGAFLAYRSRERPRDQRVPLLDRAVLAGLLAPSPDPGGPIFLPVDVPALLSDDPDAAPGPIEPGDDDLANHEAAPFIDAALATVPPARFMSEALEIATIDERRLDGMHALALVDEVALLAAPDAVQPQWRAVRAELPVPRPPALPPAPPDPCPDTDGFEVCDRPPTITAITPPSGLESVATPILIEGSGFLPGPIDVLVDGQPAGSVVIVRDDVLTCTVPGANASPPHRSAGSADVTIRNPDGEAVLRDGYVYVPDPVDPGLPQLLPLDDPEATSTATVLAIQAALVRLCHGRGDVVGLLDLPAPFRVPEAVGWQADLRAELGLPRRRGPGDSDLPVDLSFGAAYHPWLLVPQPDGTGPPRAVPPSGAIAGAIAARELDRGAWISPANDPLRGVRALEPDLSREEWAALFTSDVNLIRREAEDFRPMSAHTLGDMAELRQIAVRRLLILLRKAALEQGMDYVFETNHERFRDGVGAMLRALLRRMHDAGAFAGSTPEQSFRVETGAGVNPPASVEQGRFVALVQVAPSQPAEFITVELTRTGQGVLEVAGA
jgi:Phage tail sheath protein subtilisin-like domain/IPT/TIG domain